MSDNDRRLYDLCRKYKYYYKKYQDLKELKDAYHDEKIHNIYEESERELNKVYHEIIELIMEQIIPSKDIRLEQHCDPYKPLRYYSQEVVIRDKSFYDFMKGLLIKGVL